MSRFTLLFPVLWWICVRQYSRESQTCFNLPSWRGSVLKPCECYKHKSTQTLVLRLQSSRWNTLQMLYPSVYPLPGVKQQIIDYFKVKKMNLSVLRGHLFFRHNGQWLRIIFYPRFYPLHLFIILILEKEPVFPFLMSSAKQGNYRVPFLRSLVWRGPWLGIEPRTSNTRSQLCYISHHLF